MNNINLIIYRSSKIYFQLFDKILKEQLINKEAFLIDNNITPSSYRLSRKLEQKVGVEIIKKLSSVFNYKILDNLEIDALEKKLNEIYFNIYYKIYDFYEDDIKYIDEMLSKNYLIFPLLKLFKIFIDLNSPRSPRKILEDNKEEFVELKKFSSFFEGQIKEIYEIVMIAYNNYSFSELMNKNYESPLCYFVTSSSFLLQGKYMESLYFAKICKEKLLGDRNYKRILYLNYTLMTCYEHFEDYEECYKLTTNHIHNLKAFGLIGDEYEKALKHHIVSMVAMKKYNEVIDILENKEKMNMTLLSAYLVSLYKTNNVDYKKILEEIVNSTNTKYGLIIKKLDEYLKTLNKKLLEEIKEFTLPALINVLKSLNN